VANKLAITDALACARYSPKGDKHRTFN